MLIRRDKHGLYIRSRWHGLHEDGDPAYRPGYFNGHSHVWDTTDAGLQAGDNPTTVHVNGAPFIKIKLPTGALAYWGSYNRKEGDFPESIDTA